MNREIAQAVKNYLVELAVADKLPLDMNELEIIDLESVVSKAIADYEHENPTIAGFNYEDIQNQAEEDGTELTEQEAKDVVRLMTGKAEIPIGWDTVSYFIERYLEERD